MIRHVGMTVDKLEGATMRRMQVFLALTMVAACGGAGGPVLHPNDAALGGNPSGSGGAAVGTGGFVGTGGSVQGSGGAGAGGASGGTGGVMTCP